MVDKYQPQKFYELIGSHEQNLKVMQWIQSWKQPNLNQPKSIKPLVLWGPPGSGKSTIVKVVAKVHGFDPFFINASDERNGKELMEKVKNLAECGQVFNNWSQGKDLSKNTILILDEVDGTINSEKNSAINILLQNIVDPKTHALKYNIPIIFICNNIYTKGLKVLRQIGEVIHFQRERDMLLERVSDIIQIEGYQIKNSDLEEIVDRFNSDIRSVLNFV